VSHRGDQIRGQRAHGGGLLVPCLIHDAYRYWLLADTGAAMTMLAQRVVGEIELDLSHPLRRERFASIHKTASAPVVCLSSLQVGSKRAMNLDVLVLPLPDALRIDGILEVDFLELFRLTFDFDRRTLALD